jgi:hypothetical protein
MNSSNSLEIGVKSPVEKRFRGDSVPRLAGYYRPCFDAAAAP